MTNFAARLAAGTDHEKRVTRELEHRGWAVAGYGQGSLPEPVRAAVQRCGSRLRFAPDLLAAGGGDPVAIDCKDRMRSTDTGRYAIRRECVNAGLQFIGWTGITVLYVFGNLGVLTPTEVMSYGSLGARTAGTGAYYLVPERLAHHFDDVFGVPKEAAA